MKNLSIATSNQNTQQVQEVQNVKGKSFHQLLKSLAHEYGEYRNGEFSVNVRGIDIADKKLILGYLLEAEDYEDAHRSSIATEAYFKEYLNYIEDKMCDAEYEAYLEIMEEAGLHACRHHDNNEIYFIK